MFNILYLKIIILSCLSIGNFVQANLTVINKSDHYLRFREEPYSTQQEREENNAYPALDYRLAPDDNVQIKIRGDFPKGSLFEVMCYSSIDKAGFERVRGFSYQQMDDERFVGRLNKAQAVRFQTPDDEFGTVLKKNLKNLPELIITHDSKTNKPVINFPQNTKELKAAIEKIKEEKLSKTKEKSEGVI